MLMGNALSDVAGGFSGDAEKSDDWSSEICDCCEAIWGQIHLQKNIASDIRNSILKQLNTIKDIVIRKHVTDAKEVRSLLKTLMESRRNGEEVQQTTGSVAGSQKGETFRDVVLRPPKIPKECKLVVKPKMLQAPEETIKFIKDNVDPVAMKVSIHSLTTKRNGMVIVAMDTVNSKEQVKEKLLQKGASDYLVENPNQGMARVIVTRVDKSIAVDKIAERICEQNQWLIEENADENGLTLVKEIKTKYKDRDVVIETLPSTALKMIRKGFVGIGYSVCRIRPYVVIDQCYHCGSYGHHSMGRRCREPKRCVKCGKNDHDIWDCKTSADETNCYICKMDGRSDDKHSAVSTMCPIKRRRLDELQKQTAERWARQVEVQMNDGV